MGPGPQSWNKNFCSYKVYWSYSTPSFKLLNPTKFILRVIIIKSLALENLNRSSAEGRKSFVTIVMRNKLLILLVIYLRSMSRSSG